MERNPLSYLSYLVVLQLLHSLPRKEKMRFKAKFYQFKNILRCGKHHFFPISAVSITSKVVTQRKVKIDPAIYSNSYIWNCDSLEYIKHIQIYLCICIYIYKGKGFFFSFFFEIQQFCIFLSYRKYIYSCIYYQQIGMILK